MKISKNKGTSKGLNYDQTGQGPKPRLKGDSSTTNVGKGTSPKPTPKQDSHRLKRGTNG